MSTSNNSLQYLLREPKTKKDKNPAIFLFHGYGSNEQDLFSFADQLPPEAYVISARAPYPLYQNGHAWYAIYWNNTSGKFSDDAQAITSREKICTFIDEILEEYDIDPDNVTLAGFSQGSILSYAVALSYPEKIKNVIAMSGYLNEDILKAGYENNDFSGIDFFCSHGNVDQVVPVEWGRKSIDVLKRNNIKHVYKEYPVGHGLAPQNFYDLMEWLQQRI